jgi:hypothetical protein
VDRAQATLIAPSLRRILNAPFIRAHNQSVYTPGDKNPRGETHEDVGVFSFDTARRRAVLRQFRVEGFVNQYVAELDASLVDSSSRAKRPSNSLGLERPSSCIHACG